MNIDGIKTKAGKLQKVLAILKQKTTWMGLFLLAGIIGFNIPDDVRATLSNPATWIAISEFVGALLAVLLVLFDEDKGKAGSGESGASDGA